MKIVHISDVHFGFEHLKEKMEKAIKQINAIEPDVVVLTGDLTLWGIHSEFREAYETLSKLKTDVFVVPGNHDARNDGQKYFRLYFGKSKRVMRFDDVTLVGIDSTLPDSDDGYVGPEQRSWLAKQVRKNCTNVIALHHHIVPIPHTGRNTNVLIDAAETVEALTHHCHGGIVLAGHRHVPYSTKLLRTHIIHAGSTSSYKVLMPDNNYNIVEIDGDTVKLTLRFIDLGSVEIGTFKIKPEVPESIEKFHRLTQTKRVLFLSKKNDCRSLIAEAIFNKISPMNMHALSSGISPAKEPDRLAEKVAKLVGYEIGRPKKLTDDVFEEVDYVVSFDEDVKADECWKIRKPKNEEEAFEVIRKLEELVRELIKKIMI